MDLLKTRAVINRYQSYVLSARYCRDMCIKACTYTYLMFHNMLQDGQTGFHAKHSCETALNHMVHEWAMAIDKGLVKGVVLLDLRKAFDLVNHAVLLMKLAMCGCSQQSMRWFSSYLSEHKQLVLFKGKQSEQCEITINHQSIKALFWDHCVHEQYAHECKTHKQCGHLYWRFRHQCLWEERTGNRTEANQ